MLGHVNFKYLNILVKEQLVTGIPKEFQKEFLKYRVCIESKMHNLPFKNNLTKAREIMEIIHTVVCGPFKTTGFNEEKYFISFIDDYSKIARIYCIKSKGEVFDCFVQFVNEAENLTGKKLKILRCDNGKEYLNNRIYRYCFKILLSYCCQNVLIIEQMDVETAFLNGEVTSEVYVNQPKGYADGTNRVCKLSKALYGLKKSRREWYECLNKYLTRLGFKKNNIELCLYCIQLFPHFMCCCAT